MVKIRLARVGSKGNPIFRVVVADSRAPRDGRNIETIGRYDPQPNPSFVQIDLDRVNHWVGVGAQPSDKVAVLIKKLKNGKWTTGSAPPAAIAPKQPEPEAAPEEAPAEEAAEAPAEETAEVAAE